MRPHADELSMFLSLLSKVILSDKVEMLEGCRQELEALKCFDTMTVAAVQKEIIIKEKATSTYSTLLDNENGLFPIKRKNSWRYKHNNNDTQNKEVADIINIMKS